MLRQGSSLAVRLLTQQHAGSSTSLLSAISSGSRSAVAAGIEAATVAGSGVQAPVAQYSASAAAALAAKRPHVVQGLGTNTGLLATGASRGFASSGVAAATNNAAAAASAQETAAQPSLLRRMVKAAALLAGVMIAGATTAAADTGEVNQWVFQDTASSTAQAMVDLHHDIMFFVITICTVVLYMLGQIATKFHYSKQLMPEKLTHHTTMEVIWTIIPTIIVLSIAVPSLTLIYSLDQHADRPGLTVKVIGRQWYWSYEMHDHLQQKLLDPDRLVAIAEKSVLRA